ncbi:hypothetical protein JRQ81_007577 [Phrynocephalus forsythii]|uniref:Uncharacterized protein n=1 Tax=Phrynocephalus forsythii TaxID=171643 RepID=A0A9Q1ATI5_9SAUR|nr:hypothetical protein JRQ81_007577 [Phrynocephalus forsythii]
MMEILGEFDNESPLYISFCSRISPEEFERQSLSYTQKSLQELYSKMEQNPGICASVVRKRKQLEKEEAGLASYLKAKFSSLFNGGNPLEIEEMEEEVEQLKCEMQMASNYAFAAKRTSQWLLERRSRRSIPSGKCCLCRARTPEPTTPPMPKIFGPYTTQTESSTDLKTPWAGLSSVNQKSLVNLHPLMLNAGGHRSSFQGSDSFGRPKPSSFPRPSGGSGSESFQGTSPSGAASGLNLLLCWKSQESQKKTERKMKPQGLVPTRPGPKRLFMYGKMILSK